jgi:type II secretory pathway pseudopilin PulG
MGSTTKSGFTVIETMLFLAISAALIVAILVGSGTSINIQRYRDSVTGLQSVLQNQYFQVTNVSNVPPSGALSCNANAQVVVDELSQPTSRGQDDCVILGRFITINSDVLTVDTVIGNDPSANGSILPSYSNDIDELNAYNFSVLPDHADVYNLEWGSQIAWPSIINGTKKDNTTPRSFSMLIIRSPTSGRTYTFTADGIIDSSKLKSDLLVTGTDASGHQAEQRLCVVSSGSFNQNLAIFIKSYASSANSIEIRSNSVDSGSNSSC